MKRIFFVVAILSASFGIINAQKTADPPKPAAHQSETPKSLAKRKIDKINGVCRLRSDQFAKVNNVLIDYYTQMEALGKQEHGIGKADFNNKMEALKTDLDTHLKASLDPGQWQQWVSDQKGRGK